VREPTWRFRDEALDVRPVIEEMGHDRPAGRRSHPDLGQLLSLRPTSPEGGNFELLHVRFHVGAEA